jgi:molybdenum cofactor guanylyltransferase
VLAGGSGRRLGGAKAVTPLGGRPLLAYPVDALRAAGLDPVVVAKPATDLPDLDVPVVRDEDIVEHPAAGIVAALRALHRPILVCACDMPLVSPDLARFIASVDAPLVVPQVAGRIQPLFARYSPPLLLALESALASERSLIALVERLDPRIVGEEELERFGDPARLLTNVNTPEELAAAERALADPGPTP